MLATLSFGLCGADKASAYGWANGYGLGAGGLYQSLDFPTERRVPYFAAHPPVYYSAPVPRTYGYSPFAYGPSVRTPDVVQGCEPVTIVNPYVPSSARKGKATAPKASKKDRSVSIKKSAPQGPLMIINPFVEQPSVGVAYH